MNLRKFNKRIDPWIGSILVFMIGQSSTFDAGKR